jgi:tetratricopeptide (TPR) repeat protein
MHWLTCLGAVTAVAICGMGGVRAQTHTSHVPGVGEATEDRTATLPAPRLMEGVGDAHIAVTTSSREAQAYFDQGLRLLHGFWDFEALRAFRAAVQLDPNLAMAHWGIYKAIGYNKALQDEKRRSLTRAHNLSREASDYEREFIGAFVLLEDDAHGSQGFIRAMEALIDRSPDDAEARLFLALHLMSGYDADGRPRPQQMYAQQLLANLLRTHPDSAAAHHYWIHALETSASPARALDSAARLPALAPRAGHMVHMPGHIYHRVGDYRKAHDAFVEAARVDEAYHLAEGVPHADNWNYAHNLSYLVANLAEAGRYADGVQWAARLQAIGAAPDRAAGSSMFVLFEGGTIARLHIRFGHWERALQASAYPLGVAAQSVTAHAGAFREGLRLYARGMLEIDKGDLAGAERTSESLEALQWRLGAERGAHDVDDYHARDVPPILMVAALELRGRLRSHQDRHPEAEALLRRAVERELALNYNEPPVYPRPAAEVLGEALLRAGRPADARTAYRAALRQRPRSGFALYGIARTFEAENNRTETARAYLAFLDAWADADQALPQVTAARQWLARHNAGRP